MTIKRSGLNFLIKTFVKGKEVDRCQSHSLKVFLTHARLIKWQDSMFKVYLRVSYGPQEDNFGKMVTFYNDGFYTTRKDFALVANAFINADTPSDTPEKIYKF